MKMCFCSQPSLYKGRQFKKHYIPNHELQQQEFIEMKRRYDYRAISAFVFWMIFMAVPGSLYLLGYIDKIWIFVFFALSNFSVFFAIFGWCPFHSILSNQSVAWNVVSIIGIHFFNIVFLSLFLMS